MAARKRNWQTNKTREKIRDTIRTKQLIERLEKHALAEDDAATLTATQIKAAQVLLDRTMPVLSSSEIVETQEQHSPEELLAMLETILPPEVIEMLRAKFSPVTIDQPEQVH